MDVSFLHRYRDDRARPRSLLIKKVRRKTSEKVNYVLTFPESPGNSCSVWTMLCFTVCCSMVMVVWFFRSHAFIRF